MNLFAITLRRGGISALGACAIGAVVAGTVTLPVASAAPCSASGLAATASGVLSSAGAYLDGHPGADGVLTSAATQAPEDARTSVRSYFIAHPGEFLDLQRIAQPLKDLKNQCGISVSPAQFATLFDTLSS